jgi:hypothetical protein
MEDGVEKMRALKMQQKAARADGERMQNASDAAYELAGKLADEIDALEEQMNQQKAKECVSLFLSKDEMWVSSCRMPGTVEVLVEKAVLADAVIRNKRANDPPGKMEVRARYFKPSGKWYTDGRWWTDVKPLQDVLKEFEIMRVAGKAPGISGGGKDFYVLLEGDAEEMNPPFLLLPWSDR